MGARVAFLALAALALASQTPSAAAPSLRLVFGPGAVPSGSPSFFSVVVPEGHYQVTVTLGDRSAPSDNTIYAELRRLMLERVVTQPGRFVTRRFIVDVRRPEMPDGRAVRLKDREKTTEARAWDDRLTLEFNGSHPAIAALTIEAVEVPVIYLLGDSTVCDQPMEPYASWGQMLTRFLKPEVVVANHAESGESVHESIEALRFEKVWSRMKKGDYLFVQFGHNDMKSEKADALQTYTADLQHVVDETRRHGGIPVLVTSVSRRTFDAAGKRITDSFNGYTEAVREVAKGREVPLIDLQVSSAAFYEALGPEASHLAFATPAEATHHDDYGAYEIVKCVLNGIKASRLDLARFITDDVGAFDPAAPDPVAAFTISKSLTDRAALSGDEAAWRPLLNGRDLSGWDTFLSTPDDPAQVFVIDRADGEPVVHISGQGFGVMTTRETFSNFHLRLDVKWGERRWGKKALAPRDSGLLYFVHGDAGAVDGNWPRSIEFQIQEHDMGDLYALGTQVTGPARKAGELWLYDPAGEPTAFVQRKPIGNRAVRLVDAEKPKGEWNTLELICLNGRSIHVVNGRVVMRLGPAQRLDGPEPAPLTSGRISLQTEGAEVFYRRVEVRPITEVPAALAVRSGM